MKILIVEDDPFVAKMISEWLAPLAKEIKIAGTMKEATDYIEASPETPELITLDLALPDSKRADTVEKIRDIRRRVPLALLIVISGSGGNAKECLAGGADAFFEKVDVVTGQTFMTKLRALVVELTKRQGSAETHLRLLEAVSAHMASQCKDTADK